MKKFIYFLLLTFCGLFSVCTPAYAQTAAGANIRFVEKLPQACSPENKGNALVYKYSAHSASAPGTVGLYRCSAIDAFSLIAGYKLYAATFTQTGTGAPAATVLKSDVPGTIVWTYETVGSYLGTLSGAFAASKVPFQIGLLDPDISSEVSYSIERVSSNQVRLKTFAGGSLTNGLMSNNYIEFKVFY